MGKKRGGLDVLVIRTCAADLLVVVEGAGAVCEQKRRGGSGHRRESCMASPTGGILPGPVRRRPRPLLVARPIGTAACSPRRRLCGLQDRRRRAKATEGGAASPPRRCSP